MVRRLLHRAPMTRQVACRSLVLAGLAGLALVAAPGCGDGIVLTGAGGADGGAASDCPRLLVAVPPGTSLNVRREPATAAAIVGQLPNNAVVPVIAVVEGEAVGATSRWMEIRDPAPGFVSAAFATCTSERPPDLAAPANFHLPLACGTSAVVTQGNHGRTSHTGAFAYAFDFALPLGTPMVAMADGVVARVFAGTQPGDPCYGGGGYACHDQANYVVLRHGDGTGSTYRHLNAVRVAVGEYVPAGTTVGLSGSTGYSTGPHAHVMRQELCAAATCPSIPVAFADVAGDGVPVTSDRVTSGNCPK
jgi:hypothetical protein